MSLDTSINMEELKRQAEEQARKNNLATPTTGEETKVVGNFIDKLNVSEQNTNNQNDEHVVTMNVQNNQTTNTSTEETNEYNGLGMVVNNDELKENTDREPPKYTVGLTPPTVESIDKYITEMDEKIKELKESSEKELNNKGVESDDDDEDEDDDKSLTKDEFNSKYEQSVVLIDKTGFGKVINFTEEERSKLERSKKIKLTEVENIDLNTIKTKKAKKKDFDKIIKRVTNILTTNIVLPISGYTAEIKGCSAYELISLMDTSDNIMLNAQNKWSLIHNKIVSTSIGKMDFNEFLLNTAAGDYNTFIYGILCSTYPDDDSIQMNCSKCGKSYDHNYSVQSLIRVEAMKEDLREAIMTIVDSSINEQAAKDVHDNAAVSRTVRIKLPSSGIIAEVYAQSAYDFLYKNVKDLANHKDESFAKTAVISTLVNAFYIYDEEDDSYYTVDTAIEIAKIVYQLNETDVLVIKKIGEGLVENLNIEFGFMNVTCPYCKKYTPFINMDIEEILFHRYRQAISTEIE